MYVQKKYTKHNTWKHSSYTQHAQVYMIYNAAVRHVNSGRTDSIYNAFHGEITHNQTTLSIKAKTLHTKCLTLICQTMYNIKPTQTTRHYVQLYAYSHCVHMSKCLVLWLLLASAECVRDNRLVSAFHSIQKTEARLAAILRTWPKNGFTQLLSGKWDSNTFLIGMPLSSHFWCN